MTAAEIRNLPKTLSIADAGRVYFGLCRGLPMRLLGVAISQLFESAGFYAFRSSHSSVCSSRRPVAFTRSGISIARRRPNNERGPELPGLVVCVSANPSACHGRAKEQRRFF